jgi:hypothetical protein
LENHAEGKFCNLLPFLSSKKKLNILTMDTRHIAPSLKQTSFVGTGSKHSQMRVLFGKNKLEISQDNGQQSIKSKILRYSLNQIDLVPEK